MDALDILKITFVLYIIGIYLSYKFESYIMYFVSLLWFIPVYLVDNTIIAIFSVIMFIIHIVIPLGNRNLDDFS